MERSDYWAKPKVTVPVPENLWPKLPKNPQGQLDKSCFVYVAERNEYICPDSRTLSYESRETRNGVVLYRYKCNSCEGCPLVAQCLSRAKDATPEQHAAANGRVRSIRRDEHEEVRERTAVRMATDASKKQFNRRSAIAETPFGHRERIDGSVSGILSRTIVPTVPRGDGVSREDPSLARGIFPQLLSLRFHSRENGTYATNETQSERSDR